MSFVSECHRWKCLAILELLACVALGPARAAAETPEQQASPTVRTAEALSRSFGHAVDVASPSIVTIRMVGHPDNSENGPDVHDSGDATGVVVDRTGGILTNWHVVEHAEAVFARLPDGREFRASEIRADPWSDLAVVRIRGAGELPEAQFGDSDRLQVGDWVVAVGNSFGLGLSANPGTISAMPRRVAGSHVLLLQTNAVSNPGSSGGPLLNLKGEIVGVCEGTYSADGGHDGVAFAIPARVAQFVVAELAKNGSVRWPYLGASSETLSPDVARQLGVPARQKGAVLTDLTPDAPAAELGLRPGDVITRFAGQPVHGTEQLSLAVQWAPIAEPIELTVLRDGRTATCEVRLRARPQADRPARRSAAAGPGDRRAESDGDCLFGLTVAARTTSELPLAGGMRDLEGVLVKQVRPRSAACFQGIRPGMIITHVGTQPVRSADDFKAAMQGRRPEDGTLLLVQSPRSGGHFVVLRSEAAMDRDFEPPTRAARMQRPRPIDSRD